MSAGLPANYTNLANDGTLAVGNQTGLNYRTNNTTTVDGVVTFHPLKHSEVDKNFEHLRLKVNEAGAGNNALKTIYGDTVSAAASALAASQSATNADSDAVAAAQSATNADDDAQAAAQSATDADGFKQTAASSAQAAAGSAQAAADSAASIKNLSAGTGAVGTAASYDPATGILTVPRGDKGEPGDAFVYSDFTTAQLEGLKGEPGAAFTYSDFTQPQLNGLKGATGATPTFSFANGVLTITNV